MTDETFHRMSDDPFGPLAAVEESVVPVDDELRPLLEQIYESATTLATDVLTESIDAAAASEMAALAGPAPIVPVPNPAVSPWRMVAYIAMQLPPPNNNWLTGSAFFVAPTLLLTAGHNLFFHSLNARPQRVVVFAGRMGSHAVDAFNASGFQASSGWMARDESRDFGAIRIGRDGSHIGRYMVQDIPSTPNPLVQVSGYPSADTQGRQWTGSAQITHTSNRRIVYPVATAPGHSGSPVFLPNSTTAVAIHHKFDVGVAYAVRLTKEVIDEIKSFPI